MQAALLSTFNRYEDSLSIEKVKAAMIELNRDQRLTRLIIAARLDGAQDAEIINTLIASGYDEDLSRRATAASFEYLVKKNLALSRRLRKLKSLLSTKLCLQKIGGVATIATLKAGDLSEPAFLTNYYSCNRPLRILNADAWFQDLAPLSTRRLRDKYPYESVEVMSNRDADPCYELKPTHHRTRMPLGHFIELIATKPGNDCYMVAHNLALETTRLGEILTDLWPGPPFLDASDIRGNAHLWMGPAGTKTPLHYDLHNILFLQVEGVKRFHLADPLASAALHNNVGVFSAADLEDPDAPAAPIPDDVSIISCDLNSGEALFLPVLWWHQVRSLSPSVSISFSNFIYKNEFVI
jgi:hypothetical protein